MPRDTTTFLLRTVFAFVLLMPASSNYQLQEWSTNSGGNEDSASSNYQTNTVLGETSDNQQESANYQIGPGLEFVQMSNVPPAPTITNSSNYYNKLDLIIDAGGNPSDTTFAVAISDDSFSTTSYVQSDNTIGDTLGSEDWRTYTDWGSGSGITILGLDSNTTYSVKAKSEQGNFTESGWGPTASASTDAVTLTFDIDVSSTDTETASPYSIDLGTLATASVTTTSDKVWIDFSTNAENGGYVYLYGAQNGLHSTTVNYTISSATADLSGATEGYGAQYNSVTESSGGPLSVLSPYDGTGETVGLIDGTVRGIFSTAGSITSGRGSFVIKARSSDTTPPASDYSDTITLIAAPTF